MGLQQSPEEVREGGRERGVAGMKIPSNPTVGESSAGKGSAEGFAGEQSMDKLEGEASRESLESEKTSEENRSAGKGKEKELGSRSCQFREDMEIGENGVLNLGSLTDATWLDSAQWAWRDGAGKDRMELGQVDGFNWLKSTRKMSKEKRKPGSGGRENQKLKTKVTEVRYHPFQKSHEGRSALKIREVDGGKNGGAAKVAEQPRRQQ